MRNLWWLIFALACLALANPAQGASNVPTDTPPGQSVAQQKAPVDLRDANANGLADGLERELQGLGLNEPIEVVVTLTRPVPQAEIEQAIGAFDLGREFKLINGFSGTVTAGQARALSHLPFVFRVEPVYDVSAIMEGSRTDMGVDDVRGAYVDSPGTGAGIGICFVDSGIEIAHEAFNDGGASKIAGYCNAIDSTTRPETCAAGDVSTVADDVGHGTEVAGVAAGDGTGSPYAVALHGIAPEAPIYVAKALHSGLFGATGNDVDVEAAVEWCAGEAGVRVINLSVQGDLAQSDGLDSMSRIVNAAVQAGKVVIAGTGNSDEPGAIRPPAVAHLAIAVGAYGEWSDAPEFIAAADALGPTEGSVARGALSGGPFIAPFSTRGYTSDGRTKPDVVAPGHTIASASANLLPSILTCENSCYDIVSGTSFSTPMVSGVVALILEANPLLTPDQVREILYKTARDRGALDETTGQPVKDTNYGYGIVDAYAAVAMARALGGDTTLSSLPTAMPSRYMADYIWLQKEVDNTVDFTITPAEAASGVPLSVSMTAPLSGDLYCFLFTCEYRPDIDIWLAKRVGGNYQVQWSSQCPGGQGAGQVECGPYGLEEAISIPNPEAGDYRLILRFLNVQGTPSNIDWALASYEISWGPLSSTLRPPVANQPPVPLATYTDNGGSVTLDGSASYDPEGGSLRFYSWYWDGGSDVGATPTVTLPDGTTLVTLTVVDNLDMTASTQIPVTVGAGGGNQPPAVYAGPDGTIPEGTSFDSAGSFADADSSSWSATVDYGDGSAGSLTLNPDKSFALSHLYTTAGVYTLTVTVTDDAGAAGQDTARVTVEAPSSNGPPNANAGPDQEVQAVGKGKDASASIDLDGSASSDDGGASNLNYEWTLNGAPLASGMNPTGIVLPKGVYIITLTVTDAGGLSDSDDVCIDVYNKNPSGSCSTAGPPPPSGGTGTVVGTIKQGNNPLVGVAVALDGSAISTTTDANGAYTLNDVPAGSASITATSPGGCSKTQSVDVVSGGTSTLDMRLKC